MRAEFSAFLSLQSSSLDDKATDPQEVRIRQDMLRVSKVEISFESTGDVIVSDMAFVACVQPDEGKA